MTELVRATSQVPGGRKESLSSDPSVGNEGDCRADLCLDAGGPGSMDLLCRSSGYIHSEDPG